MYVVYSDREGLKLEKYTRKHFPGTNKGDNIGLVVLPRYEDCWRISRDAKQKLLGTFGRVPAGGPATQVDDGGADKYKRPEFDDGKEPSNWHNLGEALPEEIYHSYNIKRVVVFSGLDDTFVYTALAKQHAGDLGDLQ